MAWAAVAGGDARLQRTALERGRRLLRHPGCPGRVLPAGSRSGCIGPFAGNPARRNRLLLRNEPRGHGGRAAQRYVQHAAGHVDEDGAERRKW